MGSGNRKVILSGSTHWVQQRLPQQSGQVSRCTRGFCLETALAVENGLEGEKGASREISLGAAVRSNRERMVVVVAGHKA